MHIHICYVSMYSYSYRHACTYIHVHYYTQEHISSSSLSCHADCMDSLDSFSLSFSLSPIHLYHPLLMAGLLYDIQCPHKVNEYKSLLVGWPWRVCVGAHHRTSLMSSSLLLLQCPACLVHLIWMVCEMVGKSLYCCCFVWYCFQELFRTACSILV